MKLTSENVNEVFLKCLFKDGEDTSNRINGHGIMYNVGFHPERLKESEAEIQELLNQLPKEFKRSGGGGMTFLKAVVDESGMQWAEHENVDELLCLGLASGKVQYCMPRDMWYMLPDAMPYFVVV